MTQLARVLTRSVESLFASRGGCGVTSASAVQRAICRVLDGAELGALWSDDAVRRAFGGIMPALGPRELSLFSGIRSGKTLLAAAAAIVMSQGCDCSHLTMSERPRIPFVSVSRDLAAVAFQHTLGAIQSSDALRTLLVREPTADTIELRHPSGRIVEIHIVAGARAGASHAARWLAGAVFDEFPRMMGADEGVVNWDHMRGECIGRILAGGAILNIGSPWAPYGPAYDAYVSHFGQANSPMVVVKAPAYDLNPSWWTQERRDEFKARDPDRYLTNVEAEFTAQEEALFTGVELDRATRREGLELAAVDANHYVAAMDPATRGNAWTLVIMTRVGPLKKIVLARQWVGSKAEPLHPREVLEQIAAVLKRYRVGHVLTDQYYADALRDLAANEGIVLVPQSMTEKVRTERYTSLRLRIAVGEFELPPCPVFRADLQRLKKRTTQTGVTIVLPRTSDGRHCDYAPALILASAQWLNEPLVPPVLVGTAAYYAREEAAIEKGLLRESRNRRSGYGTR